MISPQDAGLQLFKWRGRYLRYRVCHFGAKWSGWWWGRVSSALMRLVHRLIHRYHFGFIYVDDMLLLLPSSIALPYLGLVLMFLRVLGVPISWKKIRLGNRVDYVGFTINCREHSLGLKQVKADKALEGLSHLIAGRVVQRRFLQSLAGLLMWVTWIAPHLRPWLHPIFRNKNVGKIQKHRLSISQWLELVPCVDHRLRIAHTCESVRQITIGASLLAVGGKRVSSVLDLGQVPLGNDTHVWVVVSDTSSARIQVSQECAGMAQFFTSALRSYSCLKVCSLPTPLPGCGAADARATKDAAFLGGWWSSNVSPRVEDVRWFYLEVRESDIPEFGLNKDHSKDISFYEALAQVILAVGRLRDNPSHESTICLTQGCDNAAAVGASSKCFTTKAPLCYALQMLAHFCFVHDGLPKLVFVPGKQNIWADRISRWESYSAFVSRLNRDLQFRVSARTPVSSVWHR